MGFLSFLTQGKKKMETSTSSSSSTSSTALPGWYTNYTQNLADKATAATNTPYQRYAGDRVANLNATEQQAGNLIKGNLGAWRDPMNAAMGAASSAANFEPGQIDKFMNPYTGAVVNEIGRLGRESFSGIGGTADTIRSEFTGSGGFGSRRNMDVLADASLRNERDILGQQSMALQSGYGDAVNNMFRSAEAGTSLGGLAQLQQSLGLTEAGALSDVGAQERGIEQQELDIGYGDYLDQRDFGLNRALAASQVMQGQQIPSTVTTNTTGTQSTPRYEASPLQTLTGIVGLGAGVKSLFSKDGGRVRSYRKGGRVAYRRGGLHRGGCA